MDRKKLDVKESAEYDNFMDRVHEPTKGRSLEDAFGGLETEDTRPEWEQNWEGMPDYTTSQAGTGVEVYKQINVRFRNKEDYEEFAKLIGQGLTPKTKTIWYPRDDRIKNSLMRWIEGDE